MENSPNAKPRDGFLQARIETSSVHETGKILKKKIAAHIHTRTDIECSLIFSGAMCKGAMCKGAKAQRHNERHLPAARDDRRVNLIYCSHTLV